jgi:small subunit ribosomal protein S13
VTRAPKNPSDADPKAAEATAPVADGEKGPKKDRPQKGRDGKAKGGKAGSGTAPTKKAARVAPDNPNFRYIVRLAGADLDGLKPTGLALTGVRGVGRRISEMACRMAAVNPSDMIGNLPEHTVDGIEALLTDLANRAPAWVVNHPTDHVTGETHHFFGPDLETARRDDINQMKMIRSYRGVRHERGQKVRGQRTRSNGRTGMAAGVIKKDAKAAAADAKSKEGGGGGGGGPAAPAAAPASPTDKKPAATTDKKPAAGDKKAAPAAEKKA